MTTPSASQCMKQRIRRRNSHRPRRPARLYWGTTPIPADPGAGAQGFGPCFQAQGGPTDGLARRSDGRPARGRHPCRRPTPRPGRGRLGQDARDHPARCRICSGRHPGRIDPRRDLHQQGRRRDARAHRRPGAAVPRLGRHVPRHLRPAAPQVRQARRHRPGLLHLRPERPHNAPSRTSWTRSAGTSPAGRPNGSNRPSAAPRTTWSSPTPGAARRRSQGRPAGPRLRGLRATPPRRLGRRLRRPARAHRRHPQGTQGRPRRPRPPLSIRARGRVPGHQPGPVRHRPRPVGQPPQPLRHRRPGSVDLRMAGCRSHEHPRIRTRLPRLPGRHAPAELPEHQEHPQRGRPPDPQQPQPQAKVAPDREPPRRAGGIDRLPRETDEAEGVAGRIAGLVREGEYGYRRHRRLLPDDRADPPVRAGVPRGPDPLPDRRAASRSTSGRRSRTSWATST